MMHVEHIDYDNAMMVSYNPRWNNFRYSVVIPRRRVSMTRIIRAKRHLKRLNLGRGGRS